MLDGIVKSLVVKAAQGNNRPAAEVIAVSPLPIADLQAAHYPALPAWLDESVVNEANKHARDIAPMMRELLAEPSFMSGLERLGSSLAGDELVHTSYFDHSEILDLLGVHVAWAEQDMTELRKFQTMQPRLWNWFRQFKSCVEVEISNTDNTDKPEPVRPLIRPRRRTDRASRWADKDLPAYA